MTPSDQRLWATLIHLGAIVLSFLPALVGYLVLKDRGGFIREHTRTALNFQISLTIYSVAIGVLSIPTFGLAALLYIPLGIASLVLVILAAVAANNGQAFTYPLTIELVK